MLLYFSFFIIGTALFIFLFHTPLFSSISVFFYRGVVLLVVSSFLIILMLVYLKKKAFGNLIDTRDIILLVTLIFCLNLVFFTLVPVTVDRSMSIFLLGYMNKHSDAKLTNQQITKVFIEEYVQKNKALNKRFDEQLVSGNIVIKKGGYQITNQGKSLIHFFQFTADLFGINKKNISL
jgi:uncharacterized membrane protein